MKYLISICVSLSVFIFPSASYGWTPCFPFCDSICGAPALVAMGSAIQASFSQQQAQVQSVGSEIASVNNSFVSFGQNYTDDYTNDTFDRLSGLSASTARVESGWIQLIKAKSNLLDHELNEWKANTEKYFNASQAASANRTFGDASQSSTGYLGACSAGEIKQAFVRMQQVSTASINVHKRYIEEMRLGDSLLAISKKNGTDYIDANPMALVHDSSLSDELVANLQGLLSYLVTPITSPSTTMSSSSSELEQLQLLRQRFSSAWIAGIAAEILSSRAIYDDLRCESAYTSASGTGAGNSLHELLKSKIEGRITSDGYWGATKLLLNAGLSRELVYLKAEENMLLHQKYKAKARRNELLAFIVVQRTKPM